MKTKKQLMILGIFLMTILLFSIVSAYKQSDVSNFGGSYGGSNQIETEEDYCQKGQDFIVQIAPFGCTPSVVRSDLLEEQNVPVYCELAATQINPLIDVNAIEDITFDGESSDLVRDVGFQPSRAALGTDNNVNFPVLDDIGSVVILLGKQENASAMPEYVEGNLTAHLDYDIKNAFGIGTSNFYLPEMSQSQWEQRKLQYSFWNGRGYLKADFVGSDRATISLYSDTKRLERVNLDVGEESNKIYLPGFDCLASLRLKLHDVVNPDTRARLNVNGEYYEVGDGEKFLNSRCVVNDLDKYGLVQEVEISCKEDQEGFSFGSPTLQISPRVNVTVCDKDDAEDTQCIKKEVGYGDKLYEDEPEEKTRNVFVGYIGENLEGEKFIVPVISQASNKEDFLDSFVNKKVTEEYVQRLKEQEMKSTLDSEKKLSRFIQGIKESTTGLSGLANYIVSGSDIAMPVYENSGETSAEFIGSNANFIELYDFFTGDERKYKEATIEINNFMSPVNTGLSDTEKTKETYESAVNDYELIVDSYESSKAPDEKDITLGEKSLLGLIRLSSQLQQKQDTLKYCEQFKEKYPKSDLRKSINSYCDETSLSNSKVSSTSFLINGEVKDISFEGVKEPGFQDYGATIEVDLPGNKGFENLRLEKNEIKYLDNENVEFIQLVDLDYDKARIEVNLKGQEESKFIEEEKTLVKDKTKGFGSSYAFTLKDVNLDKQAKVSVIPGIDNAGTDTNFSFKVGIEQRSIELSPEKTKERIENLNESIEEWNDTSERLGNVVKGLKGACLATGAVLNIMNFANNLGGKSIARKDVMDKEWREFCEKEVSKDASEFKTLQECYSHYSDEIDSDVGQYHEIMNDQDEEFKDLQENVDSTSFLGSTYYDTDEVRSKYLNEEYKQNLKTNLKDSYGNEIEISSEKEVNVDDFVDNYVTEDLSLSNLKELELNARLAASEDDSLNDLGKKELKSIIGNIYTNHNRKVETNKAQEEIEKEGLGDLDFSVLEGENLETKPYTGRTADSDNSYGIQEGTPVKGLLYKNQIYILELKKVENSNNYRIINVYEKGKKNPLAEDDDIFQEITSEISIVERNKGSYKNEYQNPEVKYYETEPYEGLPALVPFDTENGWYAYMKQTLPTGGSIRAYDESGRVNSFWLCNVGENNLEDRASGDDICQMINLGTGMPYDQFSGLSKEEASEVIDCAVKAVEQASRARADNPSTKKIRIRTSCGETEEIKVGSPAVDSPELECEDFMSPKHCKILYNVCDPVICPSSRCDLGGAYPVKDVIQSGIIGSLVLCLPNFIGAGGDVAIPVCLTGVKAGIDGFISIQEAHRDCLKESLETGKMVGICDQIYSIHLCEFFWRQSIPLAKMGIPRILEFMSGKSSQGGGEYLGVQDAWSTAKGSWDHFTQQYAENSYQAFQFRNMEDVGGEVCKNYVSGVVPEDGDILDSATQPDSPAQFHGSFEEIEFTSETNPPKSQYKVYYHIYAGNDRGGHYKVYLSSGDQEGYYEDTSSSRIVANGYVEEGDYASETKDFLAPSGYKELCIQVNEQEECGFKEASTSFAANYVQDKHTEQQAEDEVTTEQECVSGSASIYSFFNLNPEAAASETIDPELYNQGVTRICATENPGKGSDSDADSEGSRWVDVGYCGERDMRCWIDTETINQTIKNLDIRGDTLEELNNKSQEALEGEEYLSKEEFNEKLSEIENTDEPQKKIDLISETLDKTFWQNEKAYLYFLRGEAYSELAKTEFQDFLQQKLEKQKEEALKERADEDGSERQPGKTSDREKSIDKKLDEAVEDKEVKEIVSYDSDQEIYKCSKDDKEIYLDCLYRSGDEYLEEYIFLKKPSNLDSSQITEVEDSMKFVCNELNINPPLIESIIKIESNWDSSATSSKYAQGLMQLMEKGAIEDITSSENGKCKDMCNDYYEEDWKDSIKTNIKLGSCYLTCLRDEYKINDVKTLLAAYNAGPTRINEGCDDVDDYSTCSGLPEETQNYVKKVLGYYCEEDYVKEVFEEEEVSEDKATTQEDSSSIENANLIQKGEKLILDLKNNGCDEKVYYKIFRDDLVFDNELEEGSKGASNSPEVEFSDKDWLEEGDSYYAEVSCDSEFGDSFTTESIEFNKYAANWQIPENQNEKIKWALEKIEEFEDEGYETQKRYYGENEINDFVNTICNQEILTEEECEDIKGEGTLNLKASFGEIKQIIEKKAREQEEESEEYEEIDKPDVNLKSIENSVVNVKSQEEYDLLMKFYELNGWNFVGGALPTEEDFYYEHEEDTCIEIKNEFRYDDCGVFLETQKVQEALSVDEFYGLHDIDDEKKEDVRIYFIQQSGETL